MFMCNSSVVALGRECIEELLSKIKGSTGFALLPRSGFVQQGNEKIRHV